MTMTSQTQTTRRAKRTIASFMALAITGTSLSACGPAHTYNQPIQQRADNIRQVLDNPAPPQQRAASVVAVADSAWIGGEEFRLDSGSRMPSRFSNVQFQTERPSSIQDIAAQITKQFGMPTIVTPSRFSSASQIASAAREQSRATNTLPPPPGGFMAGNGRTDSADTTVSYARDAGSPDRRVPINYTGSLAGLADAVGGLFDYGWEYRDGVIRFLPEVTRTYNIQTTHDESEFNASLSNDVDSGSGGSGGGANATKGSTSAESKVEGKFKIWDELKTSVEKTVGPRGDVTISRAMSAVTITAAPSVHSQVQQVIDNYNEILSRQVAVTVQVVTVTMSNSDALAFDIDGFFRSISGRWRGIFTGVRPQIDTNAAGINATVLQTAGQLGQFRGSDLLVQSLAEMGNVSVDYNRRAIAMNGQVAPFQNVRRRTFVQELTQSNTANVGTQVTAKQGTINTGFTFMVLPRIMPGEQIQMRYSMNIASLLGLTSVSIGGNQLQQPDLQTLGDSNLATVRSGETLVISAFEQIADEAQGRGMVSPDNPLLGGSGRGAKNRTFVAVIITPEILNPRAPTTTTRAADVRVQ